MTVEASTGKASNSTPLPERKRKASPIAPPPRLGLFGGSFNPVHFGHLLAALTAKEALQLDCVHFIPAAESPFKPGAAMAAGTDRAAMLRLALADCPWSRVDCRELTRGGVSYTIETLREFAAENPGSELFYLIGADHLRLLPKWKNAEELAKLATFVVVARPGEAPDPQDRLSMFRVTWLPGFQLGISSSLTRRRVQEQQPIDWLVPPQVREYISRRKLYQSD